MPAASIIKVVMMRAVMMDVGSTSDTAVNFYQITLWNNPEDSHLHAHCYENLKSPLVYLPAHSSKNMPQFRSVCTYYLECPSLMNFTDV
jgi:hypothetical protein